MNIKQPTRIAVQRRAAAGDTIMTTGIVRELKRRYNDTAEIYVITDFPDAYVNNPYVTQVYTYENVPDVNWDVIYDLDDAYELNPDGHFVDTFFHRVFGLNHGLDQRVELYPSDEERARVNADIATLNKKYIAIHMRQWHWPLKNIDPQVWFEMFAEVFSKTVDYKFVCVGGPTDFSADHPLIVNYNGRYNFRELQHFLNSASLFIGIDSAPFHCAAASDVPMLVLLNHVSPENILPYRHGVKGYNCDVIQANVDCVGCHARQPTPVRTINCEKGNFPCSQEWSGQTIGKKVLELLKI